ncbi:MAG: hypothetical protein JWQ98_3005 [Chlorobi bacterium]|nr:hypothetical protein [Chlorobiota bacterium]
MRTQLGTGARRNLAVALIALATLPAAVFAQTNPLKLIKGKVLDSKTGKFVPGGKVLVFQGSGTETVTTSKINPSTGAFQVILGPSTTYRLEVESPKYYMGTFTLTTPAGANYEETIKDIPAEPIAVGTALFTGRLFEPGSAKLGDPSAMAKAVDFLKKQKGVVVALSVTPDMIAVAKKKAAPPPKKKKGTPAAEIAPVTSPNSMTTGDMLKQLGSDRVTSLRNYLKQQGISTTRITFDIRPGIELAAAKGKGYPDNVSMKVSSLLQSFEGDDD